VAGGGEELHGRSRWGGRGCMQGGGKRRWCPWVRHSWRGTGLHAVDVKIAALADQCKLSAIFMLQFPGFATALNSYLVAE
jgi:hypothetical protein